MKPRFNIWLDPIETAIASATETGVIKRGRWRFVRNLCWQADFFASVGRISPCKIAKSYKRLYQLTRQKVLTLTTKESRKEAVKPLSELARVMDENLF